MSDHDLRVATAFSRTAEKYDRFAKGHPNLSRMRARVYAHLINQLPVKAQILELNAGTGTDAVFLAQRGFSVHATDIAPGMLARARAKVVQLGLEERVTVETCSFTALERLGAGPFDAVFSNLGGLNCLADLRQVTGSLPALLRPGGLVTWVLMPPVCLWELAMAFTGDFKFAFRRLSRNGTLAHLEGEHFMVHYFTPRQAVAAFGPDFTTLSVEGLSVFAPPAESKNLAKRHPRLYSLLCRLDDRVGRVYPWSGWGDFYILSLRYTP